MTNETHFGSYTDEDVARMVGEAIEAERSAHLAALVVLCLPTFLLGFLLGWLAS